MFDKIKEKLRLLKLVVEKAEAQTEFDVRRIDKASTRSIMNKTKLLEEFKGWVAACVDSISDDVAMIDLRLFQVTKTNEVEEVNIHPALDILHRANDTSSKFDHFWLTTAYLELTGEAPWLLEKDENDNIINIFFLRPDRIEPVVSDDDLIKEYKYTVGNVVYKIPADKIIFLKYPNPAQPFRGLGTLQKAAIDVDTDNFSLLWNRTFYQNSARPDSILTVNIDQLSEEQKDVLKKSLEKSYKGTSKAHNTMVLFGDMKFEKSGFSQKDMDFFEQQKFSRDKILGIFRVPKAILSQTDGVNLANAKTAIEIFTEFTIKPKMERIIQQLNEFLLPQFKGTENMFLSYTDPVPKNKEVQATINGLAINKWKTINEVRNEEGLGEIDGGDVLYLPLNIAPIGTTPEVKELAVKKTNKLIDVVNIKSRIKEMRSRNIKYFKRQDNLNDVRQTIVKEIKKEVKGKLKKKIVKKDTRVLSEEEKFDHWKQKDVLADKHIPQYEETLIKEFKRQGKQTNTKFRKLKKVEIKQNAEDIYATVKLDVKKETDKMLEATFSISEDLFKDSGDMTFELMGVDETMDTTREEIQKLFESTGKRTYKSVNTTTNNKINTAIVDGLEKGESVDDIQERLRKIFTEAQKFRADQIARTETVRYNSLAAEQAFEDSGVVEAKEWYINPGACEFCRPMNGKIASLGGSYFDKGDIATGELGGRLNLDFDDTQSPPLHPSCKCILIPRFIETKNIKPKVDKCCKDHTIDIVEIEKEILKQKKEEIDETKKEIENSEEEKKKEVKMLKELRKSLVLDYNKQADES